MNDYKNIIEIISFDGVHDVNDSFEDLYTDKWYTVIDKQLIGEMIGREILDEFGGICKCHGFNFSEPIYNKIGVITDMIRKEIYNFAIEYLGNNICDYKEE